MPEETTTMTVYEIITAVVAVIALLQPWAIKLWNMIFKKLKITLIPSGKMKLFYNRSGAYVQIGGVIEAKNQDAVIKDISAKIIRLCDNAELKMDWSSFNAPVYQSVAGNIVTTTETARPFKIKSNDLSPVFVEFSNIDDSFLDHLAEIHNSLVVKARSIANPTIPLEDARQTFKATSDYQSAKEELLESFYWKVSQYVLRISVHYGSNGVKNFSYKFSLDQAEIVEFKKDIEKAMDSAIDNLYGQMPHFYYPCKDYIEVENSYADT